MAISKDDILSAIEEMSVMDLVELISAIEEKFGVTAAAAVAAAPAAAGTLFPLAFLGETSLLAFSLIETGCSPFLPSWRSASPRSPASRDPDTTEPPPLSAL